MAAKPFLKSVDHVDQLLAEFVAELARFADVFEDVVLRGPHVVEELGFEPADVFDRDGIEVALGAEEDRDDLLLDR